MKRFFQSIKKYFPYIIRSAKADLKSEIADSYFNWLWWIIEPICFMFIYIFVFGYILKSSEKYFATFVFIGITFWQFFYRMIIGSIKLVVNNKGLINKIYIPKYILLISKSLTYLFKLFVSLFVCVVIMIIQSISLDFTMFLIIPVIIILYIVSLGISLIMMHFGVYFSDLYNLMEIVLRMVFYISGIFYNIRLRLKGIYYYLLRANPIAFLIDEGRKSLLHTKMISSEGLLFWLAVGLILCFIGIKLIHKYEDNYAKVV